MLPQTDTLLAEELAEEQQPDLTFFIEGNRILRMTEGLEAVKQAVYLILHTERFEYLIYSWDYGTELEDLYGQPNEYVFPELERRITEALTQDDRITGVDAFSFTAARHSVLCSFTVQTIYGNFDSQTEVTI